MKKIISFIVIIAVSFSLFSGCNKKENNNLVIDGKDVVLRVGDSYVTANELFLSMLNGEISSKVIFDDIERFVIEKTTVADQSIINNVRYEVDKLDAIVRSAASLSDITYREALENELRKYGVSSIEEYEDKLIYELRRDRAITRYLNNNKEDLFDQYMIDFMPFHASHILINFSTTSVLD